MLDRRKLRCFTGTAGGPHCAGAADRLRLERSALSLHIRHLEAPLGLRLRNRPKRPAATLTEADRILLPEAIAVPKQIERAQWNGRTAGRGKTGRVGVAYIGSATTVGLLTELLRRFRRQHFGVQMDIVPLEAPKRIRSSKRLDVRRLVISGRRDGEDLAAIVGYANHVLKLR